MPNFTKNKLRWFWVTPILMIFHLISFASIYGPNTYKFYALLFALGFWTLLITFLSYCESKNHLNSIAASLLNTALPVFLGLFLFHISENTIESLFQYSGFALGVVLVFQIPLFKAENWMPVALAGRVHDDEKLRKWVTFLFHKECQKNNIDIFDVTLSIGKANVLKIHPDTENDAHKSICDRVAHEVNEHMKGDRWPQEWNCLKTNSGDLIDSFEKDRLQALKPHLFQLVKTPFSAHEWLNCHHHLERQKK